MHGSNQTNKRCKDTDGEIPDDDLDESILSRVYYYSKNTRQIKIMIVIYWK